MFVTTLTGAGRVVLSDFATGEGSVGAPADAREVITVGAADAAGKPLPGSASGTAFGAELLTAPAVLSPAPGAGEEAAPASSLAAGFAAGFAASAISAGVPVDKYRCAMGIAPGAPLRVPGDWPRKRQ